MTSEERSAWVIGAMSVIWYSVYLAVVLPQLAMQPVGAIDYVPPLLWTIGGSIASAIVVSIVVGIGFGMVTGERDRKDVRDVEISRFGDSVGSAFLVIGGLAAIVLAIVEADWFWIANAVYLCFALNAVLASGARIAAYRFGFQPW